MSDKNAGSNEGFWSSAGKVVVVIIVVFAFMAYKGNNSSAQPQVILDKTVRVSQDKGFIYKFVVNNSSHITLTVDSKNSIPLNFSIVPEDQWAYHRAGLASEVYFLNTETYKGSGAGKLPKGIYYISVKHGIKKGWFDDATRAAQVSVRLSSP